MEVTEYFFKICDQLRDQKAGIGMGEIKMLKPDLIAKNNFHPKDSNVC